MSEESKLKKDYQRGGALKGRTKSIVDKTAVTPIKKLRAPPQENPESGYGFGCLSSELLALDHQAAGANAPFTEGADGIHARHETAVGNVYFQGHFTGFDPLFPHDAALHVE